MLPPWEKIHITDNERYETYELAVLIYKYLLKGYAQFGYDYIEVPFGTVKERTAFILQNLKE